MCERAVRQSEQPSASAGNHATFSSFPAVPCVMSPLCTCLCVGGSVHMCVCVCVSIKSDMSIAVSPNTVHSFMRDGFSAVA